MLVDLCKQCSTKLATHNGMCEYCKEEADKIFIASKYFDKGYSYEDLCYGDDLNGKEDLADEIWEYVVEIKGIGTTAFKEKYKNYKLYF